MTRLWTRIYIKEISRSVRELSQLIGIVKQIRHIQTYVKYLSYTYCNTFDKEENVS